MAKREHLWLSSDANPVSPDTAYVLWKGKPHLVGGRWFGNERYDCQHKADGEVIQTTTPAVTFVGLWPYDKLNLRPGTCKRVKLCLAQ